MRFVDFNIGIYRTYLRFTGDNELENWNGKYETEEQ